MKRFWDKVKKGPDCWEWQAGLGGSGYGQFRLNGHAREAHRVSWELVHGSVPDGLCVLHRCDNPKCVNPAHLFLGSRADNNADRDRKGRQVAPRGEEHGRAVLTDAKVQWIRERVRRGDIMQKQIAAELGISCSLVSQIVRRNHWKHI